MTRPIPPAQGANIAWRYLTGQSIRDIAVALRRSYSGVRRVLVAGGVPLRGRGRKR